MLFKCLFANNGKKNITNENLLKWDEYKDKQPNEALPSIYSYVESTSKRICEWYWSSIKTKKNTSLLLRGIAFLLLMVGTAFPIFAAIQDEARDKLLFTQWAVVLLAIAGLTQVADKVFGWSSGWMRYITTVTTMENLTRVFQLEWAKYLVSKTTPLDSTDTKALFELARGLEQELLKLQADETTKWVAEFNTGISLLDSLIKTQREETDKKLDAIRTSLATQDGVTKAEEKSKQPGSLEVTLKHKAEPETVRISLDNESPIEFLGHSWSKLNIASGQHILKIQTLSTPPLLIEKVVDIKAVTVERIDVKLAP